MDIGELAELVAGKYPALADGGREGIDPDTEVDIGFLDAEKISGFDGAVPVLSKSCHQGEPTLVDAAGSRIEDTVVDVHSQGLADHEVAGAGLVAQGAGIDDPAFDPDLTF